MALERSWLAAKQSFTADGTVNGIVTVSDTSGFYVGQTVQLLSDTQGSQSFKIGRIEAPNKIWVRLISQKFGEYSSASSYLVVDNAVIGAPEQRKPIISLDELEQYTYELEPILAKRVIQVDQYGRMYGPNNPMPVTSSAGGLAPSNFDDIKIIKNSSGDPTQYQFYLAGMSVGNINVFYDSFGAKEYKKA